MPAILGGPAMRPQGPPSWPIPDEDVRAALLAAYDDGSWGRYFGNYTAALERRLQTYFDLDFVLLCGSGTFAIELALRAAKIGPGDEVLMAAYDYPGNFHSIHAVGAHPALLDLDPDNWNFDPELIKQAVGPATRAVIASHLHGGLLPMQQIVEIAKELDLLLIEDAAQAPGARVEGRKAGTCGDVGILSFGGSKLLSAGRGGALLTRRSDIAQRARLQVQRAGNLVCPMSELQAAVLLPQLEKLDSRNEQRLANVERIHAGLVDVRGLEPLVNAVTASQAAFYKLGLKYDADAFGLSRDVFVAAMRGEGIAIDAGFHAQHVGRSPRRFRKASDLPVADEAHHRMLVLHHPVLLGPPPEVDHVAEAARKIYWHADQIRQAAINDKSVE